VSAREPTGFDAAGNLYVLDAQAGQVVVIDPLGELVRTVGRKGEGPGEFDGAGRLFVWRDGRFAVVDMGQAAYQVFGPDGELERYVRMGGDAGRLAFLRGMRLETRADPAGGALIAQGMPSELGAMSGALEALAELTGETLELPEAAVDESGLERLDLTGEVVSATPILRAWKAPGGRVIDVLRRPFATVRGTTPAPSTSSARTASTWEPSPRKTWRCRPPTGPAVSSCTGNSTNWTCRPSWSEGLRRW